jgi:hypothetical protein
MAPKTVDTDDKSVGGPRYMRAIVSLDDAGNIQVRTHTYVHMDLAGFTGGVVVSLSDSSGNVLYVTPLVQYGVDGRLVFWSQSDRWDNEYYTVAPEIAARTDRIDVWVGWAPRNRFWEDILPVQRIIELIIWVVQNWPSSDTEGGSGDDRPVQSTYQALTAARGDLIPRVAPEGIPFDVPAQITVSAHDSASGAAVEGVVYKAMSLPLDRAGVPLGAVGTPLTATLSGQWISQRRVHIDPDSGQRVVTVVRHFVQERLYVRTAEYGDVAVPFTMIGAPSDPQGDDLAAIAVTA